MALIKFRNFSYEWLTNPNRTPESQRLTERKKNKMGHAGCVGEYVVFYFLSFNFWNEKLLPALDCLM